MDQPRPNDAVFGAVPAENRLSLGRLTKLSAARPEILWVGTRRMRGVREQPDCEDAQSNTGKYEEALHFLAQRLSDGNPTSESQR